jgi:molecular chaperone IbpA
MEDVAMRTFDPTPLWRSTIGFDRLFDLIDSSLGVADDNYPPYNIERAGEDTYHLSLAVAGFSPDEVNVTAEQNMLTVEGRKADQGDHEYLYQGVSSRPFRRQFSLADYVQVKGASFKDGLLQIELKCELPEAMKPRRIMIESGHAAAESQQVEHKTAA